MVLSVRTSSADAANRAPIWVLLAATLPLTLWYLSGGPGVIYNLVQVAALAAVVGGIAVHRPERLLPWVLIAVGLSCEALGDALWLAFDVVFVDGAPFPSLADGCYLLAYPFVAGGLVLLGRNRRTDRAACWDAVTITGVGCVLVWSVLSGVVEDPSSLAGVTALAYPAASLVLLGAALYVLLAGSTGSASAQLLLVAVMVHLVADAVYAPWILDDTYVPGSLIDAGWLAAFVLVGVAALHPSMRQAPGRDPGVALVLSRRRFVVLALTGLTAAAIDMVVGFSTPRFGEVLVIAVAAAAGWRLYTIIGKVAADAVRDPLTGLHNRARFLERLGEEIRRLEPGRGDVGVVMCDVDQFKVLNDAMGFATGDAVLRSLGAELWRLAPPTSTIARYDGDLFAILTTPRTLGADELAERIREALPLATRIGADTVQTTFSIGVASTADPGADPMELVRDGEAAMYRAKELGRCGLHRFDEDLRIEAVERHNLEQEIRHALDHEELFCVYQPEIELATGRFFGFEALVRWNHPSGAVYGPDRFIPLVEALGLTGKLFERSLGFALEEQRRWAAQLGFHPQVAVNLSPLQVNDPELPGVVAAALERYDAPASSLWLELTETAIADPSVLADTLVDLQALGVSLAIDDFGTGWANLARLSQFHWDLIKIDRSFVAELGKGGQGERVVAATVAMAEVLEVPTLAEGVETAEQARRLAEIGCDFVQGYHYSRPVSGAQAVRQVSAAGQWIGDHDQVTMTVS